MAVMDYVNKALVLSIEMILFIYYIYGVIPFMASEVLRGKQYTQASDIYSFSMIMWEFTSGISPLNDRAHDLQLSLSICKVGNNNITKSHPQAYYTSRLLDFTSRKVNEILFKK
ncbi:hypothetical protein RclHR1_11040004 [Rhizophagus clarus]|uniref:Serine-threonine/tyrosine-protein kinase catalytic domain-containing protein n=1 Tax=Rhizophagus clarus TaxID=94130 RepID=A0A2Z6QUV7_9GLOM|nr:hypothetical protein RclHR1_11040004 [Rhizophagus clarus]